MIVVEEHALLGVRLLRDFPLPLALLALVLVHVHVPRKADEHCIDRNLKRRNGTNGQPGRQDNAGVVGEHERGAARG